MKITTTATVLALGLVAGCTEEQNLGNTTDAGNPTDAGATADMFTHTRWAITLGGDNEDAAVSVAIDPSGDVFAAGYFTGTVDFGNEVMTAPQVSGAGWLSKRSGVDGSDLWTVGFGTEPTAMASVVDMAISGDGSVIVAGVLSGEMTLGDQVLEALPLTATTYVFVAKYDTEGQLQWARTINAAGFTANPAVAVGHDGRIALVGQYEGTIEFPNGTFTAVDNDAFLVMLDGDGQMTWGTTSPGLVMYSVAMTTEDDVLVAGDVSAAASLDGVALQPDSLSDFYSARFAVDGTLLWANVEASNGFYALSGRITVDATDSVVTTSARQVIGDPMSSVLEIDALDPNGHLVWTNDAVAGDAGATAVTTLADGTVITGGSSEGAPIDFGSGNVYGCMYLAAHDHDGSLIDAVNYERTGIECEWLISKLASAPGGAIAYAGRVDSAIDVGTGTLRFAGGDDALLVMIDTPSTH